MLKTVIQFRTTTMRATSEMRRTVRTSEDSVSSVAATHKVYTLRGASRDLSGKANWVGKASTFDGSPRDRHAINFSSKVNRVRRLIGRGPALICQRMC